MTTEQNMAARLARIMGDVGTVAKKGKITSKGDGPTYKFAKDSDVLEAVNPKLADAGIILIPEHTELVSMEPTLSGRQIIANIKTGWHVTDGKESLRFETFGQGADSGDKALPKAQSNARKYAFFMLFHIVTGDDPDQHGSYEQPDRGERTPQREAQPPSRSVALAPVQRTAEEQALLDQILATPGMTTARMTIMADGVGVPKTRRANADELGEMIARFIDTPDGVPTVAAGGGDGSSDLPAAPTPQSEGNPDSSGPNAATPAGVVPPPPQPVAPNDLMDDIIAVTGGEDVTPGPGTLEHAVMRAEAKAAKAKVRA